MGRSDASPLRVTAAGARLILAALVFLAVAGVVASGRWVAPLPPPSGSGDVATFEAVISRLRHGESYYPVMGDELRRGGYPTAQLFNWRTPLLLWALSRVNPEVARALIAALGFAVLTLSAPALGSRSKVALAVGMVAQLGTIVALCVGSLSLSESWAGVCIGLSICAYLGSRWIPAAMIGLAAWFLRELAAPYCLLCALVAIHRRRWPEFAVWVAGAVGYAVYYGIHAIHVLAQRQPGDIAHATSWLEAGGLAFAIVTVRWSSWLLLFPLWLSAIAFAIIAASLLTPRLIPQARGAIAIYALLFMVVGKSFNGYWGLLTAPTWSFALGYGAEEVRLLVRTAFIRPPRGNASARMVV